MFETNTCTFIPNFTQNEQIMQKLWAKKHPSKGKGTRNTEIGQVFLAITLCSNIFINCFKSSDWIYVISVWL